MNLLFFATLILLFAFVQSNLPSGFRSLRENFCSKVEKYKEDVIVPETKRVVVKRKTFCWSLTFSCVKHEFKNVTVNKTVSVYKIRQVTECCKGYKEVLNKCIPICRLGCGHGECVQPDSCLCQPGWREPYCLTECEPNKFGRGCNENCTCFHGAHCDPKTGFCKCTEGYTGDNCEKLCPEDTYGLGCKSKCQCKNGAICDIEDGTCYCKPGYEGEFCEKPCKFGTHGQDCEKECICIPENTDTCHHVDGKCICKPGYEGEYCEKECDTFTYGRNCSKKCKCVHSDFCDPTDGECHCKPGWTGKTCSEKCPLGKFGENCTFECALCLKISGNCDHVTGECYCPPGFHGELCRFECSDGFWGSNCTNTCNCTNGKFCDGRTGKCPVAEEISKDSEYHSSTLQIVVFTIMIMSIIFVAGGYWIYCVMKNQAYSPTYCLYIITKKKGSKLNTTISNPIYDAEVVLDSHENGDDYIKGSHSAGVQYVKNNVNSCDADKSKQSNIKIADDKQEEICKIKDDLKDLRKSHILTDIKDALKDMKRCSMRSSLPTAHSTQSSTVELDKDYQPEIIDDFNTIENIYEKPTEMAIENIYDKPAYIVVGNKNLSVKEQEEINDNVS